MKSKSFCALIAWLREGKIKQNSAGRIASALLLACSVGVFGYTGAAKASVYNFSYEFSTGDILSGQFDGTISGGDPNLLEVSSVISASFNGTLGPALPFVDSTTNYFLSSGSPAVVSFDGGVMDIVASTSPCCGDGFVFLDSSLGGGMIAINTGLSFGGFGYNPPVTPDTEIFDAANWSLTAASETPLPASFPLLATGLGAMGMLGWRRKRKAAALALAA
jgi:hypothetical protein